MKSLDWICVIKNGHLSLEIRNEIASTLRNMEGQRVKVTLSEVLKERSGQQNRYYWGVVIKYLKDFMDSHGNSYSKEDIHEYLKTVLNLKKEFIDHAGEVHSIPMSTADLSTMEFEAYMEGIRAWAAEVGCSIPLPNEGEE